MAPAKRLIVNADDFGRSTSINHAVIEAHQRGILTSASLMPAGEAFDEAVRLAKAHPTLGIGLHLTLCLGRAILPPSEIPSLASPAGEFSPSPVAAGIKYFFSPAAQRQLHREIEAQFERFAATGLPLDHVNGHLHFHLHPAVLRILLENHERWGIRAMRLMHEPARIHFRAERGRWLYRLSHAAVFALLARRARPLLLRRGIRFTDQVFGLLQNGRVDEDYLLRLLPEIPEGVTEIYSHPCRAESRREFEALTSPKVIEAVRGGKFQLMRCHDLC